MEPPESARAHIVPQTRGTNVAGTINEGKVSERMLRHWTNFTLVTPPAPKWKCKDSLLQVRSLGAGSGVSADGHTVCKYPE